MASRNRIIELIGPTLLVGSIVAPAMAQPLVVGDPAQAAYAQAVAQQQAGNAASVDFYYQAALLASRNLSRSSLSTSTQPLNSQAWAIYHASIAGLIQEAQRHGRFDPRAGLKVNTATGAMLVPARYGGFAWRPEDFQQLWVVGEYPRNKVRHIHRRGGLGVPLIVRRQSSGQSDYLRPNTYYAATVVLRVDDVSMSVQPGLETEPAGAAVSLDFYNSNVVESVPFAGQPMPLAADTTAPLVAAVETDTGLPFLDRFRASTTNDPPALYFTHPYQPGKIPVILIHGLLSDPSTWIDLANDLMAIPDVADRYQFWTYKYPSVEYFLESAAIFRAETRRALATIDPLGTDPALRQMVLVGHSMGGLLAKLQVTHSGSVPWSLIANRPFEMIVAETATKAELHRALFFEPQPFVRRVVFIGTPHRGSSVAARFLGRLGSVCVTPDPKRQGQLRSLILNNPNTFSSAVTGGLPNSFDLLEPQSVLIATMERLPINPHVRLHSIIGTGYPIMVEGDADGYVSVASARHPGVLTETLVRARHNEIHHQEETLQTLRYILDLHYAEYEASLRTATGHP